MNHVNRNQIFVDIADEIANAERKYPEWPKDEIHCMAIVSEESGEAMRAAVQLVLEGGKAIHLYDELKQTCATAIRLMNQLRETYII